MTHSILYAFPNEYSDRNKEHLYFVTTRTMPAMKTILRRAGRDARLRGRQGRHTPRAVELALLGRRKPFGDKSRRKLYTGPTLDSALSPITRPLVVRTPPGAPSRARASARAGLGVRLRRPVFGSPEPQAPPQAWMNRTQATPEGIPSPTDPTPERVASPVRVEPSETPTAPTGVLGHQLRARPPRSGPRRATFGELPWH